VGAMGAYHAHQWAFKGGTKTYAVLYVDLLPGSMAFEVAVVGHHQTPPLTLAEAERAASYPSSLTLNIARVI
jgi:hypothetical protein